MRFIIIFLCGFFLLNKSFAETEKTIYFQYSEVFYYLNYFFAFFFAAEYLLRLFTCHYRKEFKGIDGKIKYIFSFYSFIDLIAFLPYLDPRL